jgi:hypothetical protein
MAEISTTPPTTTAVGTAISRYAAVRFGCNPRAREPIIMPTIPSKRLIAKESNVIKKVTSSTRKGIRYQRGLEAGFLCALDMILGYSICAAVA